MPPTTAQTTTNAYNAHKEKKALPAEWVRKATLALKANVALLALLAQEAPALLAL
jgi:hypothetical protein